MHLLSKPSQIMQVSIGDMGDICFSMSELYQNYINQYCCFILSMDEIKEIHARMAEFISFNENRPIILEELDSTHSEP